jgi:hypothetical protein
MKPSITSTTASWSILLLAIILLPPYSQHHVVVRADFSDLNFTYFTQPMNLSSNMTIDWTTHKDTHTKYCGPRTVGGYDIAKKYCSPQTACGISGVSDGTYGGSGNDCAGRKYLDLEGNYTAHWMCFADIQCVAPSYEPSAVPSGMPSTNSPTIIPSTSVMPSDFPTVYPSLSPSKSLLPTFNGQTKSPTQSPSSQSPLSNLQQTVTPTGSPVEVSVMKIRGNFCGVSYTDAVDNCDASKMCNSNSDCDGTNEGGECFPNVSCEILASESSGLGVYDKDSSRSSTEPQMLSSSSSRNGGGGGCSICGLKGVLVSVGMSCTLVWLLLLLVVV